jgi:hypothetical protein
MSLIWIGALVIGVVVVAGSLFFRARFPRQEPPREDLLLEVTACRQPGGWVEIFVTIVDKTAEKLQVHSIALTEPVLGELIAFPDPSTSAPLRGREIATGELFSAGNAEIESHELKIRLILDDPSSQVPEIVLALTISRRLDQSDIRMFSCRARVWVVPRGGV